MHFLYVLLMQRINLRIILSNTRWRRKRTVIKRTELRRTKGTKFWVSFIAVSNTVEEQSKIIYKASEVESCRSYKRSYFRKWLRRSPSKWTCRSEPHEILPGCFKLSPLDIYFCNRVKKCRSMLRANNPRRWSLRQYCKFLFRMNVNFMFAVFQFCHDVSRLFHFIFRSVWRFLMTIVNNKVRYDLVFIMHVFTF